MTPTAKSILLELLLAAGGPLPARLAVDACALFDVSENNVRVALVRLTSAGLVEGAGRGEYRLAERAEDLAREVASWRSAEERVRAWHGAYIAAHCGALGRTDRSALRKRTRALSLLGFAELERGLFVRPDNLHGGVEGVRSRLHTLGLPKEASVFAISAVAADFDARAQRLWDGKGLTASYKKTRAELERWMKRAGELEPDVAARESFLLGSRAIRRIVYDPLLPPPFVDVDERRAFVEATKEMDREGRRIWQRFFDFTDPNRAPRTNGRAPARSPAWT